MSVEIDDVLKETNLDDVLKECLDEQPALEPISPSTAVKNFLEMKSQEIRPQTVDEYRNKLEHFLTFCDDHDIDNLNDLNGRSVAEFRIYRRTETTESSSLAPKTMRDDMYLFRDFLEYLGKIEGVPVDLCEKVEIPTLDKDDGVRDTELVPERVERILEHLDKYAYATQEHVIFLFHSHTGRRPGDLYALDVKDLHLDCENPYLELVHREGETELKNGRFGETEISLADHVATVFDDYLTQHRIEITTENGRQPFLTSQHGRLSKSAMRKSIYAYTRPCVISGECPHDKDPDTCEAAQSKNGASKCPSSKSPYALRHGYITAKRCAGVPVEVISDRCDVGEDVLERHYDESDKSDRRQIRQRLLEEVRSETDQEGYL